MRNPPSVVFAFDIWLSLLGRPLKTSFAEKTFANLANQLSEHCGLDMVIGSHCPTTPKSVYLHEILVTAPICTQLGQATRQSLATSWARAWDGRLTPDSNDDVP